MYQLVCFGVWDKREEAEEGSVLKLWPLLSLWSRPSTQNGSSLSQHPFPAANSQRGSLLKVWQLAKALFER